MMPTTTPFNELVAILTLLNVKGLGPVKFKRIYEELGSFHKVFQVTGHEMRLKFKFHKKIMEQIGSLKPRLTSFEKLAKEQLRRADELNAHVITFFDKDYPPNLYKSNHSVPVLYVLGNPDILRNCKCCAVIGTRKPCDWTKRETKPAVKNLIEQGFVIVSGLAKGVDTIAHSVALKNGGNTIAVVGCGVDVIYPPENAKLRASIIKKGAVVSEYTFGTKIREFALKKRNKITVGLSDFVLITETSTKGGTMNAYRAALEQKKPLGVFFPPEEYIDGFDGNLKILKEKKVPVTKFTRGREVRVAC